MHCTEPYYVDFLVSIRMSKVLIVRIGLGLAWFALLRISKGYKYAMNERRADRGARF